jgi:hypothetical protein
VNGLDSLADAIGSAISAFPGSAALAILVLAIGFVFIWSGFAKLRDPWMAAMALVDFRLVRAPSRTLGAAVGAVELGLAAALVLAALWVPGLQSPASIAALALFAFFCLLIARAVRRGAAFACFCFGGSGDQLTRQTLLRTSTLATGAAAAAVGSAIDTTAVASGDRLAAAVVSAGVVGAVVLLRAARAVATVPPPLEDGLTMGDAA